jgi:hypothetical protein
MTSSSVADTQVPINEAHNAQSSSKQEHSISEIEKETLTTYEGHDADTPSNEGYVLDVAGELK